MPIYENKGNYLLVEKFGVYSFESMLSCLQKVNEYCKQENLSKVFFDLRDIEGTMGTLDRYELGKEVARIFGPKIKIAVASDPNQTNYLAENSAVNRGARLKVFAEVKSAIDWLEEA
jgi:hypothetical protein